MFVALMISTASLSLKYTVIIVLEAGFVIESETFVSKLRIPE
jgi:hypothetical protein